MEPILLAGYPLGSSLGLVAAFEWLGQPYRVARVEMPADMLSDAYARLNGRQETPVLITAEGVLTETIAIALWLADRLHQYLAFLNTGFTGAFSPLWAALEMQGVSDEFREALRQSGRGAVAKRHGQLEAMIGDGGYLLGTRPTLADAVFVGVARWADFHQAIDVGDYPKVRALKERLTADPAVRLAKAIEDGEAVSPTVAMRGLVSLDEALGAAAAAPSRAAARR